MKVYGQLERASYENLGSDPGAAIAGRFWWNTVDGQGKLDDGSAIRAILRNDAKAIIGNSATAAENIRFHRGAAGVLQLVQGSDATAEGSLSTNLNQLSFKFETYTDAGKPAAGTAGRVVYISDLQTLLVDTGASYAGVGGGGGGGGSAVWRADTNAPVESYANAELIYQFQQSLGQSLTLFIKIPQTYLAGRQIKAYLGAYSVSAANDWKMQIVTTLIRKNTDAIDSVTNQNTSNSGDLTNTVSNMYRELTINLTDGSGQVNSVAVSAGDILKLVLTRIAPVGTEDTADINFLPNATEIKFS